MMSRMDWIFASKLSYILHHITPRLRRRNPSKHLLTEIQQHKAAKYRK